jgi:hypothetical protein
MPKRAFRSTQKTTAEDTPAYPTLDSFDDSRRRFLVRLGGALLGAGALAACGGRPVNHAPDSGQVLGGEAPQPDSRVDQKPEPPLSGGAPQPPAKMDAGAGPEWGVDGDVTQPDAAVDKKDFTASPGFAPQPDAAVDCDGDTCPNP